MHEKKSANWGDDEPPLDGQVAQDFGDSPALPDHRQIGRVSAVISTVAHSPTVRTAKANRRSRSEAGDRPPPTRYSQGSELPDRLQNQPEPSENAHRFLPNTIGPKETGSSLPYRGPVFEWPHASPSIWVKTSSIESLRDSSINSRPSSQLIAAALSSLVGDSRFKSRRSRSSERLAMA